jgi:hypothetical protein
VFELRKDDVFTGREEVVLASGAWGTDQTWLDFGFAGEHDAEGGHFLLLHKLLPAWQTSELCSAPAQPETGGNNLSS